MNAAAVPGDSGDLAAWRHFYAEELRAVCGLTSNALVRAFETVARERFLGAGPWHICGPGVATSSSLYRETPDDDPRHVYHNVAIAIDRSRVLNNGEPGTLARWFEWLAVGPGESVVHVGCGTGYYSAILAETVGAAGSVVAIEADRELAKRARENLAPYANVEVLDDDASALARHADCIIVNAGVTHALPAWLDALNRGGRMLLPLTCELAPGASGKGSVLKITRHGDRLAAAFGPMVAIYPCTVARDPELNKALGAAFMKWRAHEVRSVRTDAHEQEPSCWVHSTGWCLSTAP